MEFEHQQNANQQPIEFLTYFVRIDDACDKYIVAKKMKKWTKARGIILINDNYEIESPSNERRFELDPKDNELDPKESLLDAFGNNAQKDLNVEQVGNGVRYVSVLEFRALIVCDIIEYLPSIDRFVIVPTIKHDFKLFARVFNEYYHNRPTKTGTRRFTAWIISDMNTDRYQLLIKKGDPYTGRT